MNIFTRSIKLFCKVLFITLFFSSVLRADEVSPGNLAIQGYSPVSYFEKNKAEMGLPQFNSEYKGKLYWFTSADQTDTFNSNPTQYIPRFDALCSYNLALGRRATIDPTNFKIIDGQLLLFHRSDEMDALKAWDHSENEDKLLRRAEGNFLLLNF